MEEALALYEYLVTDGYDEARSYRNYSAKRYPDALQDPETMLQWLIIRTLTDEETIDRTEMKPEEIRNRLTRKLYLAASLLRRLKEGGIDRIVFAADDAMIVIDISVLEEDVDYIFRLEPELSEELEKTGIYMVSVEKDHEKQSSLPEGMLVGKGSELRTEDELKAQTEHLTETEHPEQEDILVQGEPKELLLTVEPEEEDPAGFLIFLMEAEEAE